MNKENIKNIEMSNDDFLKEIKRRVLFEIVKAEDIQRVICEAQDELEKITQEKCKHDYVFVNNGYGHEECTICGKWR